MTENWLETRDAAIHLQCHPITLKRKRDISGGFLEEGSHWRMKLPHSNSPILWNVSVIQELFHKRGLLAIQERYS
ncbi:MAG: hypothetical protein AB8B36_13030 [Prochlorococcus sp.]